jgi:hypothetical protein
MAIIIAHAPATAGDPAVTMAKRLAQLRIRRRTLLTGAV